MKQLHKMLATILICGTCIFTACTADNADNPAVVEITNYSVSGISDCNGETVYLRNYNTGMCIDSTIVADGKFSFQGSLDKYALMGVGTSLREDDYHWEVIFFNDEMPVTVNLNDSTVLGSPQNVRLTIYDKEVECLSDDYCSKMLSMTEEEIEANKDELDKEFEEILKKQIAIVDRIYIEERNTYIPVAFAYYYFKGHGLEAYDELQKEGVIFAKHPFLKYERDELAKEIAEQTNS